MYTDGDLLVDLGLAQILPMFDDETGAEPKIVAASIVDPFILLIRDDASIYVAACDSDNDLEEVERVDDSLLANKWLSGCLYKDVKGLLYGKDAVIMALINTEGTLFVGHQTKFSVTVMLMLSDVRSSGPQHANLQGTGSFDASANHCSRLYCKARGCNRSHNRNSHCRLG